LRVAATSDPPRKVLKRLNGRRALAEPKKIGGPAASGWRRAAAELVAYGRIARAYRARDDHNLRMAIWA
jgi:hypothetical protein